MLLLRLAFFPPWDSILRARRRPSVPKLASMSAAELPNLSKDGRHHRGIVEGFKRVFGAIIFFGTEDQAGASRMIDYARFHFFDAMHLWFSSVERPQPLPVDKENVITLSRPFYDEINEHRISVEREVLAALANAPGLLDFYVWLAWRSFTVRGHTARIPLFGPSGLSAQLGNAPYVVARTFRLTVQRWLRTIRALWPECPANVSQDGNCLTINSSHKS